MRDFFWSPEGKKPTRAKVMTYAFIVFIMLIFYIFWLGDPHVIFKGDVVYKPYSTLDTIRIKWCWFRKALMTISVGVTIAWAVAIICEYSAYYKHNRTFYKLYY